MNHWKITSCVLGAAFVTSLLAHGARTASADTQPHMVAAQSLLNMAEAQLEAATADKGGHRVKALAHVRDAKRAVADGIKWDNEHQSKDEKKK